MNKEIDDGGPAFPFGQISEVTGQPINGCFNPGMSLRDWFAGQALAGYLAASGQSAEHARDNPGHAAAWAYQFADAMLAASKSPNEK